MKFKQKELITFCILLFVTIATKQTILERLLGVYLSEEKVRYISLSRTALNIGIGYWGLLKHETWWIKQAWCLFYLVLLLAVFINLLANHFIERSIFTINFDVLASPFFYLLACLLPRFMHKYV